MISDDEIQDILTNGCSGEKLVNTIVAIGNESLDPTKAYQSAGINLINIQIPSRLVWPCKEDMFEFHKKDLITDEWNTDPRILKLGMFIDRIGGIEAMQSIYYGVKNVYNGSTRSLEMAWNGVGEWKM